LLSDVIKVDLYYLFVLLVCGLFSSGAMSRECVTSNGKVMVNIEWETLCWVEGNRQSTVRVYFE
jgi:hypothetical protein